ncbi:hypothetical protein [Devosia sp. DBB001]|nr:hypothetical protein [Devosia sp. DBB001]
MRNIAVGRLDGQSRTVFVPCCLEQGRVPISLLSVQRVSLEKPRKALRAVIHPGTHDTGQRHERPVNVSQYQRHSSLLRQIRRN